jgi:hypothetical protein
MLMRAAKDVEGYVTDVTERNKKRRAAIEILRISSAFWILGYS